MFTFAPLLDNRAYSSAGSEHLPYKQGVIGSNPIGPTRHKQLRNILTAFLFYGFKHDLLYNLIHVK